MCLMPTSNRFTLSIASLPRGRARCRKLYPENRVKFNSPHWRTEAVWTTPKTRPSVPEASFSGTRSPARVLLAHTHTYTRCTVGAKPKAGCVAEARLGSVCGQQGCCGRWVNVRQWTVQRTDTVQGGSECISRVSLCSCGRVTTGLLLALHRALPLSEHRFPRSIF